MTNAPFNVRCPSCSTEFPVDPLKVPDGGIAAICSECDQVFDVRLPQPESEAPSAAVPEPAEPAVELVAEQEVVEEPTPTIQLPADDFGIEAPGGEDDRESGGPVSDLMGVEELQITLDSDDLGDASVEAPDSPAQEAVADEPAIELEDSGAGFEEPMIELAEPIAEVEEPTVEAKEPAPADEPVAEAAEESASEAAPAEPPLKKTSIPSPKAQPPFVDLSSLADDTLASPEADTPAPDPAAKDAGKQRFGKRDPHERAQHLARVLVSDIIAYYPVRYQESLSKGTLKEDFADEVEKSWKEYVDQVGLEMAESTPYFNQALNEVLARGKEVF